jgi:hypothetical protein
MYCMFAPDERRTDAGNRAKWVMQGKAAIIADRRVRRHVLCGTCMDDFRGCGALSGRRPARIAVEAKAVGLRSHEDLCKGVRARHKPVKCAFPGPQGSH